MEVDHGAPEPSRAGATELPAVLPLRDGTEVLVRPAHRTDRALLREAFERLSDESRYRRFLAPMPRLSEQMLDYLLDVDHHDHEAIVALDPEGREGVGIARYVRSADHPDRAEAAVTVTDDWQGRGLGTLLLELLAERARSNGIARFTATVLAANDDMLELLGQLGRARTLGHERGTVQVEVELPAEGIGELLRRLLRESASPRERT